MVLE
jgi:hypothetical protein